MVIDDLIKDCMSGCEAVCVGELEFSVRVLLNALGLSLPPSQRFLQPLICWASVIRLYLEQFLIQNSLHRFLTVLLSEIVALYLAVA